MQPVLPVMWHILLFPENADCLIHPVFPSSDILHILNSIDLFVWDHKQDPVLLRNVSQIVSAVPKNWFFSTWDVVIECQFFHIDKMSNMEFFLFPHAIIPLSLPPEEAGSVFVLFLCFQWSMSTAPVYIVHPPTKRSPVLLSLLLAEKKKYDSTSHHFSFCLEWYIHIHGVTSINGHTNKHLAVIDQYHVLRSPDLIISQLSTVDMILCAGSFPHHPYRLLSAFFFGATHSFDQ